MKGTTVDPPLSGLKLSGISTIQTNKLMTFTTFLLCNMDALAYIENVLFHLSGLFTYPENKLKWFGQRGPTVPSPVLIGVLSNK